MQEPEAKPSSTTPPLKRGRGGRPKHELGTVRSITIGVRVSPSEYVALQAKADAQHVTPAHWLRQAALSRRLPSPPATAINREEYANLARMAANLNQLARAANEGRSVVVNDGLMKQLTAEVGRLRLALIGAGGSE